MDPECFCSKRSDLIPVPTKARYPYLFQLTKLSGFADKTRRLEERKFIKNQDWRMKEAGRRGDTKFLLLL